MSRYAKPIFAALVLSAWVGASIAGTALTTPPPSDGRVDATKLIPEPERPNAISQRTVAESSPTLRCWQEGRLILEQPGVKLTDAPNGAYVFKRRAANDTTVYVFDLKNGLCTLTHEVQGSARP